MIDVDGEAAEAEAAEEEEKAEEAGWSKKNKKPHGNVGNYAHPEDKPKRPESI